MADYAIRTTKDASYDAMLAKIPEALKQEGFGVLTEIDVKETLKRKLDVDFRRYKILGACHPPSAHQVLQEDLGIGLLLPCNVVVYENDEGKTVVEAIDPVQAIALDDNPRVKAVAEDVRGRLQRVLDAL